MKTLPSFNVGDPQEEPNAFLTHASLPVKQNMKPKNFSKQEIKIKKKKNLVRNGSLGMLI